MLCNACGNQAATVGRFCSNCDSRARSGAIDRRRPVGGAQWQALWGISYSPASEGLTKRRLVRGGMTVLAVVVGVLLTV